MTPISDIITRILKYVNAEGLNKRIQIKVSVGDAQIVFAAGLTTPHNVNLIPAGIRCGNYNITVILKDRHIVNTGHISALRGGNVRKVDRQLVSGEEKVLFRAEKQ